MSPYSFDTYVVCLYTEVCSTVVMELSWLCFSLVDTDLQSKEHMQCYTNTSTKLRNLLQCISNPIIFAISGGVHKLNTPIQASHKHLKHGVSYVPPALLQVQLPQLVKPEY